MVLLFWSAVEVTGLAALPLRRPSIPFPGQDRIAKSLVLAV